MGTKALLIIDMQRGSFTERTPQFDADFCVEATVQSALAKDSVKVSSTEAIISTLV